MTSDSNPALGHFWDTYPDTRAAIDALNRPVAEHDTTGAPRAGKYVGVFYYLWHGQHDTDRYDISKIEAQDPPPWGPVFLSALPFRAPLRVLLRRRWMGAAQERTNTRRRGVDVIIFDVTNAVTYHHIYFKLCWVYTEIRQAAGRTPQVAFLTHGPLQLGVQPWHGADAGRYQDNYYY